MPAKFLESLGGKLAEQWAANLLTPAFIFWMGGLAAWINKFGWHELQQWFTQLGELLQIAVLVSSLLLIAATAFAVQRFDLAVLRFFEGYWPTWMNVLRHWLLKHQRQQVKQLNTRWQTLAAQRDQDGLAADALDEFVAIDWRLRQVPAQPDRLMPTRLGNLLRAAESQASDKYGLDAMICWARLWLVLPAEVKQDLQEARAELNTAARVWLWGVLFLIWTVWAWWAILVAILVAWFAYGWMLAAAATYGDLLEAAFDLHRLDLYQALHMPPPANPAEERLVGRQLTEYLWRGSDREKPAFVDLQERDHHKPN